MTFPVRFNLNATTDAETTAVLARILEARLHGFALADLPELIDAGNELVLWELARHLRENIRRDLSEGVFPSDRRGWTPLAARLIARAIRDADHEGVLWTPVLDTLAGSPAWRAVVGMETPDGTMTIPSADERTAPLASMIAGCDDSALVRRLLDFRAEIIHRLVAEHASALDSTLVSALHLTPDIIERICQTRPLDSAVAAILVERAYHLWKETFQEACSRGVGIFLKEADTLRRLLADGHPFSSAIRKDLLDLIRTISGVALFGPRNVAAELLLSDRSLPAEVLVELSQFDLSRPTFARIMAHPNCPDELWRKLAADTVNLETVIQMFQMPPDKVADVYSRYRQLGHDSPKLLEGLIQQENSTSDIWLFALAKRNEADRPLFLSALSSSPRARQHPEVRKALLKSSSIEVILNLLKDQRPDEFEPLILKLLRSSRPEHAFAILAERKIPPGTPVPRKLLKLLLKSDNQHRRLLGITLLSEFEQGRVGQEASRVSDEPAVAEADLEETTRKPGGHQHGTARP